MSGKLTLSTQLDQRLLMNQKLRQMITILQYTTVELKEKIQELIETNPLVELKEDDESDSNEQVMPDWMTISSSTKNISYNDTQEDYLQNIASETSLRDFLINQTLNCHFGKEEQAIAEMIIDLLDEDGFISFSSSDLIDIIHSKKILPKAVDTQAIESILEIIQTFEPFGIGSKNLQQCLTIQLNIKNDGSPSYKFARKIIEVDALSHATVDLKGLQKITGLSQHELSQGLCLINTLDFHPARSFTGTNTSQNEPEVYVKKIGNEWKAFLVDSILTKVEINNTYKELIKQNTRDKSYKSILNLLQEASYLLSGIKRRNETLLRVANFIVGHQQKFLSLGPSHLQSITLREVAEALELHESTISRITTGKFIATPQGVYELKYFFPSHVSTTDGESKSSTSVKEMIKKIIESESKNSTYSDDDIAKALNEKGVNVSRRTVAKYRESMNIPTSYLRKNVHELVDA